MQLSNYFKTPLEQMIEDRYLDLGFINPANLEIEQIAALFEVDLLFSPYGTFSDNEDRVIFLNQSDDVRAQRVAFYHELCHVIRHTGDQRRMPELFRQLQESDAERFSLYAAIPFFMLKTLQLPARRSEAISYIEQEFNILPEFAQKRLEQIEDRINGVELLSSYTYPVHPPLANQVKETQSQSKTPYIQPHIRAYYGLSDFSRPHTLVIEQHTSFNWEEPLFVEIGREYKSCDPTTFISRDGALVMSGDLSVLPNQTNGVTINMSRVAWRHGRAFRRLFLPLEAVDDAIDF